MMNVKKKHGITIIQKDEDITWKNDEWKQNTCEYVKTRLSEMYFGPSEGKVQHFHENRHPIC